MKIYLLFLSPALLSAFIRILIFTFYYRVEKPIKNELINILYILYVMIYVVYIPVVAVFAEPIYEIGTITKHVTLFLFHSIILFISTVIYYNEHDFIKKFYKTNKPDGK